MYEYKISNIVKIIDGDSLRVDLDLGFKIQLSNATLRLHGIDTPESRQRRRLEERKLGIKAKEFLVNILEGNKDNLIMKATERGKFGRILAEIFSSYSDNTLIQRFLSVNEMLIDGGHARRYYGGNKGEPWTKEEGCDCGGDLRKGFKQCTGTWYRWTQDGYVEIDDTEAQTGTIVENILEIFEEFSPDKPVKE